MAHEPDAHLHVWLMVGARMAVDPRLPEAVRTAASEQAAVCRDLLAQRGAPAAGEACRWDNPAHLSDPGQADAGHPEAGAV